MSLIICQQFSLVTFEVSSKGPDFCDGFVIYFCSSPELGHIISHLLSLFYPLFLEPLELCFEVSLHRHHAFANSLEQLAKCMQLPLPGSPEITFSLDHTA